MSITPSKNYTLPVSIALVIANMIGTGVFTSLGYQVGSIPSGFAILMLWLVGGLIALSGAFTYAEISTTLKRSGGEYFYLSKIFHPALGFVCEWMSAIVGFAGAISAVAIAIGEYSQDVLGIPTKMVAVASIIAVSTIHWFGVKTGGLAQTILTSFKLSLIVFFCLVPFFVSDSDVSGISFMPVASDLKLLIFILYQCGCFITAITRGYP